MVPLAQCMPGVLATLLRRQPLSPAKVAFSWRMTVGPAIDRATTATLGEDRVLVVRAGDRLWRREIERSAALILSRMEKLLGADVVARIVVRE